MKATTTTTTSNSGRGRRGWTQQALVTTTGVLAILWMTWNNIRVATSQFDQAVITTSHSSSLTETLVANNKTPPKPPHSTATAAATVSSTTKILGFADYNYRDYALRWSHRLTKLGYTEHVIVAVDQKAVDFFTHYQNNTTTNVSSSVMVQWEALPYPPCVGYKHDPRGYRRQIFGRRWTFIYEQLIRGHHILMTDVDNVFSRYLPMKELEDSTQKVDVFHAYSTSYPTDVFEDMGLTVCGGMSWLRSTPSVIRFVGSLVNRCKCMGLVVAGETTTTQAVDDERLCRECQCDDQVALNELLWKGKHKVLWDRNLSKPKSLKDYPWEPLTGISSKTRHKIAIWDRNVAYRAPMPEACPPNNWVAMPLYVDRSEVVEKWDALCPNNG
jgi:hypothetical protein